MRKNIIAAAIIVGLSVAGVLLAFVGFVPAI